MTRGQFKGFDARAFLEGLYGSPSSTPAPEGDLLDVLPAVPFDSGPLEELQLGRGIWPAEPEPERQSPHVPPGWAFAAWRGRLEYLAGRCRESNPTRAAELWNMIRELDD